MPSPPFRHLFRFLTKEIEAAFPKRHKFGARTPGLKLVVGEPTNRDHGKLLIITPRAAGKAHQRNLLRRRIKSIYYQHELYKTPIYHLLVVYKEATRLTYDQLKEFLTKNIAK